MKVTFACTAISGKNSCHFFIFFQPVSKRNAVGYAHLRSEVRNHSHNVIVLCSEVKRTISAFCKSTRFSLPLGKQSMKGDIPGSKYTQVTMHGENILIGF